MKTKWLDRRIAAPGPYLTLVLSQGEFDAAMDHFKIPRGAPYLRSPRSHATTHCIEHPDRGIAAVVALGSTDGRTPIEIAGLLVHEAVHVWQHYCDAIGESRPGEEQEAYGIQAVAQELMAEYARRLV